MAFHLVIVRGIFVDATKGGDTHHDGRFMAGTAEYEYGYKVHKGPTD